MSSSLRSLIILALTLFTLSGCGDLLGTKIVKRDLDTSTITNLGCELDTGKFSEIMDEVISSQIRCLGEYLNFWLRVVKTRLPGHLDLAELEAFLRKDTDLNLSDSEKKQLILALNSFFDVSHLITGERPGFISKETMNKVVELAVVFNIEAVKNFQPIFSDRTQISMSRHRKNRERIGEASAKILKVLIPIFNASRPDQIHKLNIISLLENFTQESNREYIDKAKKVLFLKKVFIGGENEVLTNDEVKRLIDNFSRLTQVSLDLVRYRHILLNQKELVDYLRVAIRDLYTVYTTGPLNNRDGELIFTVEEAFSAVKLFVSEEDFNIEKFRKLIVEAKTIIMEGNSIEVRGKDLKNLFTHASSLLQTGITFYDIWEKLKTDLERTDDISPGLFDDYRLNNPASAKEVDQFERIARKYRFFKGEFQAPFYIRGMKRNADGFFEIALLEYGIKLLFKAYGVPNPNPNEVGTHSMDKMKMQNLIMRFRAELFELDLITPGREISTADNISLLGTLFQYQSDKNGLMDVNEGTEFAVALLSSIKITDDIFKTMAKTPEAPENKCSIDEFNRLEPVCFKEQFWSSLKKDYSFNFPLMLKFVDDNKTAGRDATNSVFLQRAIGASRGCNFYTDGAKEEIPFSKGDIMSVLIALMHAETTVLRWDKNGNNTMDPDEVMDAYEIYSPALDGFLDGKPGIIKALKKQIYQYLIKYEQVPNEKDFSSLWKFVKFLLSFNKKAPATRKTIISILDVIGIENAKLQTGPGFDCNLLRHPDLIKYNPESPQNVTPLSTPSLDLARSLPQTYERISGLDARERELLKEELMGLTLDLQEGRIGLFGRIRQVHLRRFFQEMSRNKAEMARIRALFPEGRDLERKALALAGILSEI
jgi:hypothetical protein